MIIKWVVYSISVSERRSFANQQRKWKQYANVPGFLGRLGGWNLENPIEASTFTFWKDIESYQSFLQTRKEDQQMDQKSQWSILDTQIYQKQGDISGLTPHPTFASIAECGHLLKVGDCRVRPGNRERFIHMQQSVWNLGMANTPGMTSGLFGESTQDTNRFIILTRWKNESEYQAYEEHILPKLLHWAYDGQVEEQFRGRLFHLMKDWCILGQAHP